MKVVVHTRTQPYNGPMVGFFSDSVRRIYADYASAPPVSAAARNAMREAQDIIGNPGAIHREGVEAKEALNRAREKIAGLLGVKAREIIFTSGLTDANNIAILGAARASERTKRSLADTHWIVSSIEHASVLDCFSEIERLGGTVTHVDPSHTGIITPESIGAVLTPHTVLVSVGWANNEIGTIQPLSDIARTIEAFEKKHGTTILLHTDAGQAPLYLATGLNSLRVDLCAIGGNKLYGPHGVGALFIHNRTSLVRVQQGGPQERGFKPGTENVELALGFAAAFEDVASTRDSESRRIKVVRDALEKKLIDTIPGVVVNGDTRYSLPHMLNISIPGIQSEYVTLSLDQEGISVSTKSACREGEESRSHVVEALGGESWRAQNTIRMSFGPETTQEDISVITERMVSIVNRIQ
jgi:cysteine desulfurase